MSNLRRVLFTTKRVAHIGLADESDIRTGWFHGFFPEGNVNDDIQTYAIIEDFEGVVYTIATNRMKFANNPEEQQ